MGLNIIWMECYLKIYPPPKKNHLWEKSSYVEWKLDEFNVHENVFKYFKAKSINDD